MAGSKLLKNLRSEADAKFDLICAGNEACAIVVDEIYPEDKAILLKLINDKLKKLNITKI